MYAILHIQDLEDCINSSKVYCKSISLFSTSVHKFVLIVAKCIVNFEDDA